MKTLAATALKPRLLALLVVAVVLTLAVSGDRFLAFVVGNAGFFCGGCTGGLAACQTRGRHRTCGARGDLEEMTP